jgi:hypothetical protein
MPPKSKPRQRARPKPEEKPRSGKSWQHAPEELVLLFNDITKSLPGAEQRKMFGYPCCFRNGHLLAGLFQDKMFVRLSVGDLAEFLALDGTGLFEPMPGRPMREYAVLPARLHQARAELLSWLERSLVYVETLPPKERTPKKKS